MTEHVPSTNFHNSKQYTDYYNLGNININVTHNRSCVIIDRASKPINWNWFPLQLLHERALFLELNETKSNIPSICLRFQPTEFVFVTKAQFMTMQHASFKKNFNGAHGVVVVFFSLAQGHLYTKSCITVTLWERLQNFPALPWFPAPLRSTTLLLWLDHWAKLPSPWAPYFYFFLHTNDYKLEIGQRSQPFCFVFSSLLQTSGMPGYESDQQSEYSNLTFYLVFNV